MKFLRVVVVVVLACVLSTHVIAQDRKSVTVGQTWYGDQSDTTKQTFLTIQTQEDWIALWAKTKQPMVQPLIRGQMAVAIFAGSRSTAGYRVMINSIKETPDRYIVYYRILDPSQTRIVATGYETEPWAIATIPYANKLVEFHQSTWGWLTKLEQIVDGIWDFLLGLFDKGFYSKKS